MIRFRRARYKNFFKRGNEWMEHDLLASRCSLYCGVNGSGKSTLLDALNFALFGKPFRKVNKGLVVNTITRRECLVEVEFSIGPNEYLVRRGIKPNVFEVEKNGSTGNVPSDVRDLQAYLEKQVLQMNQKSFCQVVILGSALFVPFMQLSAGDRRQITEELLSITVIGSMNKLLKSRIDHLQDKEKDLERDMSIAKTRLSTAIAHSEEIKKRDEKLIESLLQRRVEIEEEMDSLSSRLETIGDDSDQVDIRNDRSRIQEKLSELRNLESQINANVRVLSDEIRFLEDHETCPTCSQDIDSSFRCETVSTKTSEVDEARIALEKISVKIKKEIKKLDLLKSREDEITKIRAERYHVNDRLESLGRSLETVNREIEEASKDYVETEPVDLEGLRDQVEKIRMDLLSVDDELRTHGYAGIMLKDGGIKASIIKKFIPVLNTLINKYLAAMDSFLQFELNEEFEESIRSRHRDELVYESFSQGEKMRIDLAILFAWRAVAKMRNSVNTNLLVFDEVMDSSLDDEGTEDFIRIVSKLTEDNNVIIISHKADQIGDKFDRIVRFKKTGNFSSCEVL